MIQKNLFDIVSMQEEDLKTLIRFVISEVAAKTQQELTAKKSEVLRPKHVQCLLGCSRSHLDLLSQKDPKFPKVIRLGSRWTGYLKSDIDTYLKTLGSTIH
ncbi:helix-turn-helix transcriptional regulator [Thiomicrorhabdus aquaedulcis]|uniref:helix-turn-helix transcriptional regulator n=1 Tax=Thiomicrorhabdus aquaedulcis TaxID=2211106 RepID=UPI000FDCC41C|nr:AlpA family phage regulatory protein [Thiomicrorhabdus aquaedulcis]